jgi:hypothetical protein
LRRETHQIFRATIVRVQFLYSRFVRLNVLLDFVVGAVQLMNSENGIRWDRRSNVIVTASSPPADGSLTISVLWLIAFESCGQSSRSRARSIAHRQSRRLQFRGCRQDHQTRDLRQFDEDECSARTHP